MNGEYAALLASGRLPCRHHSVLPGLPLLVAAHWPNPDTPPRHAGWIT